MNCVQEIVLKCKYQEYPAICGRVGMYGHKYLGILEKGEVCRQKMKRNVKQEYLKCVKSVLKFKFNARNTSQAIYTWAVPTTRYGEGIEQWTEEELEYLDRKSRKLITMHGGLHPRSNVQRLYIPRNDGGE